uniref:Ig-like domain-containing protein n=1 Tax=Electrophorus electricus TaxID=8005 RepID=A0A4W4EVU6_ELEEL
ATASCTVESVYNEVQVSWIGEGNKQDSSISVDQKYNPSKKIYETISKFTLPVTKWKSWSTVTCRAEHQCFSSEEKTIYIVGKYFMQSPMTKLKVYPHMPKHFLILVFFFPGDPTCIGTGFNPKIKWLVKSVEKHDATSKSMMQADGRVKVFSEISVSQQDWNQGSKYTCKVNDEKLKKKHVEKICGPARRPEHSHHILHCDPTVELLMVPSVGHPTSEPQILQCIGTGFNPKIKWLVKSVEKHDATSKSMMQADGRVKVFSEISVSQQDWNQGSKYTCKVNDEKLKKKHVEKSTNICAGI